jgi:putative endonuclease
MNYYVYILSSRSRNLYTGVTNDVARRVWQHRDGRASTFTLKYRIQRLVYFERHDDVRRAISREKEIKGWRRAKKIALIESMNPAWEDLAARWFTVPVKRKESAGPSSLRSSG